MIRSFLASEVGEDLRREMARLQQHLKQQVPNDPARPSRIQWVQPSNIHLTLKFLGNTDERLVDSSAGGDQPSVPPRITPSISRSNASEYFHAFNNPGCCGWGLQKDGRKAKIRPG